MKLTAKITNSNAIAVTNKKIDYYCSKKCKSIVFLFTKNAPSGKKSVLKK